MFSTCYVWFGYAYLTCSRWKQIHIKTKTIHKWTILTTRKHHNTICVNINAQYVCEYCYIL